MSEHADKSAENKSKSIANHIAQNAGNQTVNQLADNSPEAVAQRKLHSITNVSPPLQRLKIAGQPPNKPSTVKQLKAYRSMPGSFTNPAIQRQANSEEEQPIQGKFETAFYTASQPTTLQRFTLHQDSDPGNLAPAQKFAFPQN